jgi:2-keto-4-pentenoate hydratase
MKTIMSALVLALCLLAGCAMDGSGRRYLAGFSAAERAGTPFDPVTSVRPRTTLAEAYRLQDRYVRQRVRAGDGVVGYKGGLMSLTSLRSRGVTEPLVAALFASGRADDGATISLCGYRKASFELKLGYILDAPSPGAPPSGSVLPVIDLPDIAYRDPDHYGAVDMVAANVSVARYVRGTPRSRDGVNLDKLRVTLSRAGEPIASGIGGESLGGQQESLATLIAQARKSGRTPAAGDLIVTGKIGDRGWLTPGRYVADYGPLGRVSFTVAACAR